jgi:hypothetical protein
VIILDLLETFRDATRNLMDLYLSSLTIRTNEVMRREQMSDAPCLLPYPQNPILFMPETGDPHHPSSFKPEKQHLYLRRTCNHLLERVCKSCLMDNVPTGR